MERYEISTKGMPTWGQVKKGLMPEVLDKALKLAEPTLLLVAPTKRKSKVEAINMHPAFRDQNDTFTYKLKNNNLWNGGKLKSENKWRVSIVEGVQDVQKDEAIYDGKRTNYDMSELWVKKYENQSLDVMNDVDTYLTLMMKALAECKPIDSLTWTVLNSKNLTRSSRVSGGWWSHTRVHLDRAIPGFANEILRLRGLVGVEVKS